MKVYKTEFYWYNIFNELFFGKLGSARPIEQQVKLKWPYINF